MEYFVYYIADMPLISWQTAEIVIHATARTIAKEVAD
jgi:hypothetical protein